MQPPPPTRRTFRSANSPLHASRAAFPPARPNPGGHRPTARCPFAHIAPSALFSLRPTASHAHHLSLTTDRLSVAAAGQRLNHHGTLAIDIFSVAPAFGCRRWHLRAASRAQIRCSSAPAQRSPLQTFRSSHSHSPAASSHTPRWPAQATSMRARGCHSSLAREPFAPAIGSAHAGRTGPCRRVTPAPQAPPAPDLRSGRVSCDTTFSSQFKPFRCIKASPTDSKAPPCFIHRKGLSCFAHSERSWYELWGKAQ